MHTARMVMSECTKVTQYVKKGLDGGKGTISEAEIQCCEWKSWSCTPPALRCPLSSNGEATKTSSPSGELAQLET